MTVKVPSFILIVLFIVLNACIYNSRENKTTINIQPLRVFNTYVHFPVCVTDIECTWIDDTPGGAM